MQQVFTNGNKKDGRIILIEIKDNFAVFYFRDYYNREMNWIKEETERRFQCGEDELSKDEQVPSNFYWIASEDWDSRKDQWEEHMGDKAWFTRAMLEFLNKNL